MAPQRSSFGLTCMAALPFILFFCTYYLLFYAYQPRAVTCPHVIGKDCFTALKELSAHNLYPKIMHLQEDEQRPSGTITAQIPQPYQHIKEKQTVYLTVCQRPKKAQCPSLLGLDKEMIQICLHEHGYEGDIYTIDYPEGTNQCCFAQWPHPHEHTEQQVAIVYIAQHQPDLVIWPDLVGLELAQAQAILARYGIQATLHGKLHPNKISYVCAQMPLSGSIIDLSSGDLRAELSITIKPPKA
jgi:beta-lactam-binding protein with PASTA domain